MAIPPRPETMPEDRLAQTMRRLMSAPDPLGIELLTFGTGPLTVAPDSHGILGLDRAGDVVLIVGVREIRSGTAAAISDELDHLARMSASDLQQLSGAPEVDLQAQHAERFGGAARLNADQQVVVVTSIEPSAKAWKELVIELGSRLKAVHRLHDDGTLTSLQPPAALQRSPGTGWSGSSWLALAAVLLGVGILLLGVARLLLVEDEDQAVQTLDSPIRTVASGVPADSTHGNWIGQRRAVVTSKGRIILAFRSGDGLQLVTDQSNRGRSWRSPLSVSGITPSSFAVALDQRDDLHVAFIEDDIPRLVSLRQSPTGWSASEPIDLADEPTTSSVIDLSWDTEAEIGYAIWAQPTEDGGEELRWATLRAEQRQATVSAEGSLISSSEGAPILANVASGRSGTDPTVLVTYRGEQGGWFSQLGSPDPDGGALEWQPEEQVPAEGGIGASALVVDDTGTAHLLLRNDTGPRLEYFRRSLRGGWSSPEQVADAASIEEIDLPVLAVDQGSRMVYAFFETAAADDLRQVQVAFRDPAAGWEGPYKVAPPEVVAEGSTLPVSTGTAAGEPLVFWTTGGGSSSVQSARVVAP